MDDLLDVGDRLASILTAVIATAFWFQLQWERRQKRLRLEAFLRDNSSFSGEAGPEGAHSLPKLVAYVRMSESDIMEAAFRSKRVSAEPVSDFSTGRVTDVMLAYDRDPPSRL